MTNVGIIGVGDMGIGLSANLLQAGYTVIGYDLSADRLVKLQELGGKVASSIQEIAQSSNAIFIMVLNGSQLYEVTMELIEVMKKNSTIFVTATVRPKEIQRLIEPVTEKQIHLVDCPVSGGKPGADQGTLTLMAAGPKLIVEQHKNLLSAIGEKIFHVGENIGDGQTVKAALQVLIGANYTAMFEAMVLGVKAGVDPQVLYDVISTTAVGGPLFQNCIPFILEGKFENTGSHIGTMYKDLCISMDLAQENQVPMFTGAAAKELFQAGIGRFPKQDNWSIIKILEEFAGIKVRTVPEKN